MHDATTSFIFRFQACHSAWRTVIASFGIACVAACRKSREVTISFHEVTADRFDCRDLGKAADDAA